MNKIILSILIILNVCFISKQSVNADQPIIVQTIDDGLLLSKNINKKLVIIFKGEKCVHCTNLIEDINNDPKMVENTIICYIDTQKNKNISKQYKVSSIPVSIVYKNDKIINRIVGYSNKKNYKNQIDKK